MSDAMERLGSGRHIEPERNPDAVETSAHQLTTADGATVSGLLRVVPGARTVVTLMHPRQDVTHHPLVPQLLRRGYAVWTQGTRSPNNDITLVHEQAILDVAAGHVFLRQRGFEYVVTLGHSGGGTLSAFYHEQSILAPEHRLTHTPAGRRVDLAAAELPVPDAAIFVAPHPGQGALLLRLIDPSVIDESDPLSVDPTLNAFDPSNGFSEPPTSSTYSADFVRHYRAAQLARIERIDAAARARVAEAEDARQRFKVSSDPRDRRAALAPRVLTVYRTDADLRLTDLSISPNERPYGSLFGRRPDLTNYGLVGFGRFTTPDAWLSTWSGLSSNARFVRCAPAITAPSLFIELTGDQACFPEDATEMVKALGSEDRTHIRLPGTHFGGPLSEGAPSATSLAGAEIGDWLATRVS